MNERVKGYVFVILSAVLYGMYPIASKFAYAGGATPVDLLLLKGTALLPLAALGIFGRNGGLRLPRENRGKLARDIATLAVSGAVLTPLLLLTSYSLIPAGTATSLHYTYCVITLLLCVLFYKEKLDWLKAACVAMCVGGVFLLYAPSSATGAQNFPLGALLALASAATFAFYTVYMDKSNIHAMGPVKLQFYILCVSVPISLVYALLTDSFSFKMSAPAWGAALAYYMFGAAAASIFFQKGVHAIGSQRAAILSTIEPITSVMLGIFVFSESMTWRSAIGIAVILTAAVLVTAADGIREKRTR